MSILQEIGELLQKGRAPQVKELVQKALDEGIAPQEILDNGLLAGMGVIGGKFKNNEVFVPEVLIAARAMNAGAEILKPALAEAGVQSRGTVILGTVKGDLHDIDKNLVKMMFEGKGLEVIDIGIDVPAENFVAAAKEHKAQIVACSALLTTTMPELKTVVDAFSSDGSRGNVKIMVGGAPVTQTFCDEIGADYYAPDAASAADVAISIV